MTDDTQAPGLVEELRRYEWAHPCIKQAADALEAQAARFAELEAKLWGENDLRRQLRNMEAVAVDRTRERDEARAQLAQAEAAGMRRAAEIAETVRVAGASTSRQAANIIAHTIREAAALAKPAQTEG